MIRGKELMKRRNEWYHIELQTDEGWRMVDRRPDNNTAVFALDMAHARWPRATVRLKEPEVAGGRVIAERTGR
jgi:hypothetical protein